MEKIYNNRFFQFSLLLIAGFILGWILFSGEKTDDCTHTHEADMITEWTCSMHPQIRQSEPGKCPLCGMDLIPVSHQDDHAEHASPFIHSLSPVAAALADIQTTPVKYKVPEHKVYLTGKIAQNERRLAVITANFSGRIEKLFVDFTGQTVVKGEKLATIYSPELVTAQQELLEAGRYRETNPVLYEAVKEKLRLWQITDSQIKDIEETGVVVTELDLYANTSGIVTRREVSQGDYVSRGNVLFEIADLNNVWVMMDAYESDIPWLKTGQQVDFTLTALPGKVFTSTVTFVNPFIDPRTRTVPVRAEADNPGILLKPGMFVNAVITAGPAHDEKSLLIPKTAVLWTGKRSVVYTKVSGSESPAYEMKEILLGPPAGDLYVVESGLQEGEEVVTNGAFAIDSAAQLRGIYSMMSRPVSMRLAVPDQFKTELTELVSKYFSLKNDLITGSYKTAGTSAKEMLEALDAVDMNLLGDEEHSVWMGKEMMLRELTGYIANAQEIEEQRKHFSPLSDEIIEIAEKFGLTIDTVFVNFCPMALGDEGAYWLSEFEDIQNPYFGDAMLRCGEIVRRINAMDSYLESTPGAPLEIHHH